MTPFSPKRDNDLTTITMEEEEHQHAEEQTVEETQQLDSLCGAQHFVVGLSPLYWSHVPLCIADVIHLGLVNGVHCIMSNTKRKKCIPIQKCSIVGTIVVIHVKSESSIHYVLDDGTGLMDCIAWGEQEHYRLPNLLEDDVDHSSPQQQFHIGDVVHVLGRIKAVSVKCKPPGEAETIRAGGNDDEEEYTVMECIREVKVTSINHVQNQKSSTRHCCLDEESRHMIRVAEWKEQHIGDTASVANGVDVLKLLGPTVAQQALSKTDFPAADDDVGAWRVFGTSCQCTCPYKDALLYCHCQATAEALDPFLIVRDAVLMKLLHAEQQLQSEQRLVFSYSSIALDASLLQVIRQQQQTQNSTNDSTSVPASRVVAKTFSALRKDGVLHLQNDKKDEYMLISRSRVLEPHLMQSSSTSKSDIKLMQLERQTILHNVPKARLQYVKRCSEKERRDKQEQAKNESMELTKE